MVVEVEAGRRDVVERVVDVMEIWVEVVWDLLELELEIEVTGGLEIIELVVEALDDTVVVAFEALRVEDLVTRLVVKLSAEWDKVVADVLDVDGTLVDLEVELRPGVGLFEVNDPTDDVALGVVLIDVEDCEDVDDVVVGLDDGEDTLDLESELLEDGLAGGV